MKKKITTITIMAAAVLSGSVALSQTWNITGNSNATGGSKLGTTNNIPLRLFTFNTQAVHINANVTNKLGFVGIGTTAPNTRLHVAGVITATGGTSTNWNTAFTRVPAGATNKLPRWNGTSYVAGMVTDNGTNVGIGIAAPFRKLQVQDGDLRLETALSGARYLEFIKTGTTMNDFRMEHSSSGSFLYLSASTSDFASFTDVARFNSTATGTVFIVFGDAIASGGTWQNSDAKLKREVQDFSNATDIISRLKPKTYFYKKEAFTNLNLPAEKQYGLIAQEVEQVLPELVKTSQLPVRVNSYGEREMEDVKSINYIAMVPLLIKGMQELIAKNEELQNQLNELKSRMQNGNESAANAHGGYLNQNVPNPSGGTTTIGYFVEDATSSAYIIITDMQGVIVNKYPVTSGEGQVIVDTSRMSAGAYNYTLYVDDKKTDTKTMVISK